MHRAVHVHCASDVVARELAQRFAALKVAQAIEIVYRVVLHILVIVHRLVGGRCPRLVENPAVLVAIFSLIVKAWAWLGHQYLI